MSETGSREPAERWAREPAEGWVSPEVRTELPGLGLVCLTVEGRPGRSPRGVRHRLRELSSRFPGARGVTIRQEAVPSAYRVFYRQIGLDPDVTLPPGEGAAVDRLLRGEFRSRNLLDDALTIALLETGVPVWALDAEAVVGPLGVRISADAEALGRRLPAPLPSGRLVVADHAGPVAVLFGRLAPGHGVAPETTRMTLFAIRVAGVPPIHVEEALWTCVEVLEAAR